MSNRSLTLLVLSAAGLLGFCISFYTHSYKTKNRSHHPQSFVKALENDPKAGAKIYKEFCAYCHEPRALIEVHAPKVGDSKAWQAFKKLTPSQQLSVIASGIGPMPARGGCFECSDKQLLQTIEYMVSQ